MLRINMTTMSITINDSVFNILEKISHKTGIEKSKLIEIMITDDKSLEDIEIEYMIKKVKEEDKWHSWEDVKKEINL
jgi:ribosomal protein S24E